MFPRRNAESDGLVVNASDIDVWYDKQWKAATDITRLVSDDIVAIVDEVRDYKYSLIPINYVFFLLHFSRIDVTKNNSDSILTIIFRDSLLFYTLSLLA